MFSNSYHFKQQPLFFWRPREAGISFPVDGHYTNWNEANCAQIFSEKLGKLRESVIAFRLPNEKKFAEFIQDNMRPQPRCTQKFAG